MGLTSTIKSAVSAGFTAVGDVKIWMIFQEVTGTEYNPVTGETNEITTDSSLTQGLRRDYSVQEVRAGIAESGEKRIVIQKDDIDFDLSVIDRIMMDGTIIEELDVMTGGDTWQIKDFKIDAVGATYVIRISK